MVIATDVYGRTIANNGASENRPIGKIFSEHRLDAPVFEVVQMDIENYDGFICKQGEHGGPILTFAKSLTGYDLDIVNPICLVTSGYQIPIYVLASGTISKIAPFKPKSSHITKNAYNNCSITVIKPGPTKDTVIEYDIYIPRTLNLERKIVYLKKFDIYIGGASHEQMCEIKNFKSSKELNSGGHSFIEINVTGNINASKQLHFCLNGLFGVVNVEPSTAVVGTVQVKIGDTVLKDNIDNMDLLMVDDTIYCAWDDLGGINFLLDCDYERLIANQKLIGDLKGTVTKDVTETMNDYRGDIRKLDEKLISKERDIREKDKLISDLKTKLADTEYELKGKITEIESELKLKQEEFKTRREEIKYHSTVNDSSNAKLMEFLKLSGALLGTASLIVTVMAKMQATKSTNTKTNNVIEWSIPVMMKKSYFLPAIAAIPTGALVVGVGLLLGMCIGIACDKD